MTRLYLYLTLGLLVILTFIYMLWMPGKSYKGKLIKLNDEQIAIKNNTQFIINYLASTIGPRSMHEYEGLKKSVEFLSKYLKDLGFEVKKQMYTIENTPCYNLEVEIKSVSNPNEIIVIGAHYDSVAFDCPGANDNGSGVAGVLELARLFKNVKPNKTLRFVLFVNEEPPYFFSKDMGSYRYAKRAKENGDNIVAMLCLETIGYYSQEKNSQNYPFPFNFFYPSTGNFIAFVGNIKSAPLVRRSLKIFRQTQKFPSVGGAILSIVPGVGWSDHWAFWKNGYKAIMITDTALYRYPYYHTKYDTADKIDYDNLARVISGIKVVIEKL